MTLMSICFRNVTLFVVCSTVRHCLFSWHLLLLEMASSCSSSNELKPPVGAFCTVVCGPGIGTGSSFGASFHGCFERFFVIVLRRNATSRLSKRFIMRHHPGDHINWRRRLVCAIEFAIVAACDPAAVPTLSPSPKVYIADSNARSWRHDVFQFMRETFADLIGVLSADLFEKINPLLNDSDLSIMWKLTLWNVHTMS